MEKYNFLCTAYSRIISLLFGVERNPPRIILKDHIFLLFRVRNWVVFFIIIDLIAFFSLNCLSLSCWLGHVQNSAKKTQFF